MKECRVLYVNCEGWNHLEVCQIGSLGEQFNYSSPAQLASLTWHLHWTSFSCVVFKGGPFSSLTLYASVVCTVAAVITLHRPCITNPQTVISRQFILEVKNLNERAAAERKFSLPTGRHLHQKQTERRHREKLITRWSGMWVEKERSMQHGKSPEHPEPIAA